MTQRHRLFQLAIILLLLTLPAIALGQRRAATPKPGALPKPILLQIVMAEDERRWDETLAALLNHSTASVRIRAALATGRIGKEEAVPSLTALLQDKDERVRSMAAFALGEIESNKAADALVALLRNNSVSGELRARSVEALGKIAAALPREQEPRMRELGEVILQVLKTASDRQTTLLGLTAALRARPANAGPVIGGFLGNPDARIRADAANALARLRAKEANQQLRGLLKSDVDPVVRANAARALGAAEDKAAFDGLLARALDDDDSRVRVSAVRALASLRDGRAADPLLQRGAQLLESLRNQKTQTDSYPTVQNELLEIATTLGRLLPLQIQSTDRKLVQAFFLTARELIIPWAPEVELAFVRTLPGDYIASFGSVEKATPPLSLHWLAASSVAAALGETASLPDTIQNRSELRIKAELLLRGMLNNTGTIQVQKTFHPEYATPEILRGLAAHKPMDLADISKRYLNDPDVVVRGTAADLLGGLPPSEEITSALLAALPRAQMDDLNDAALSILDSLAKQKTPAANKGIMTVLDWKDHLIRRRAVTLLQANGVGELALHIGIVQTTNTRADYDRALARIGRPLRAIVTTTKGSFTIKLLPNEAPLTVDNFARLAQRGYFQGVTIHRVVPNFVIQDGDPRGDGNGGPGYQIRCEINQVPYDRAAVGMALSGKDTGGSQWFVTHSPQPHLDGGYTVFGRVIEGMNVVDNIVRGDKISSITIH